MIGFVTYCLHAAVKHSLEGLIGVPTGVVWAGEYSIEEPADERRGFQ
jgi:hypothetical protein